MGTRCLGGVCVLFKTSSASREIVPPSKERREWDLDAEDFFNLRCYAQRQHRVPTEIEEVIGDADRSQVQNVFPDVGDLQLDEVAGGNE
jgi:hypothetical protein